MTYIILKPGRDMGKWGQTPTASRIQRLFFPQGGWRSGSASRQPAAEQVRQRGSPGNIPGAMAGRPAQAL
jgi:hypothetical protein